MGVNRNKHQKAWEPHLVLLLMCLIGLCLVCALFNLSSSSAYSYLVLSSVTICILNPIIYLLHISITCRIFLVLFILSHLLLFKHATNITSPTPVSPSQRTHSCTRQPPDHFSSLWGSEALLIKKVTRPRCLRQKDKIPSKPLSFRDKNKTGLHFPPLNC